MVDSPSWPEPSGTQPGDSSPPPPPPTHPVASAPGDQAPPAWPDDAGDIWRQPTTGGGRPTWLVLSIIGAVLVGLTTAGIAGVLVARSSNGGLDAAVDAGPEPGPVPFDEPTFAPDVVAGPEDGVTAELLEAIDLSEQTMIEFQIDSSDGLGIEGGLAPGGDEVVVDAATTGAARLEGLRSRLGELGEIEGGAATDGQLAIRDSYVEHLDAWRRWMQAVADDPTMLEPGVAERDPFSRDIETTAEDFVVQMRRGLPADTPEELRAYAEFILERGFAGTGGDGGELV